MSLVLLLVACGVALPAAAAPTVTARATVGDRTTLDVQVRNAGERALSGVVPEVVYQGLEVRGDRVVALAPGAREGWTFTLPAPREPGTIPAAIQVRYEDASGAHTVPAVAAVSTPGLLPVPDVAATLTTAPAAGFAQAELILENPTATPIHGRVVILLPAGLSTEPTSQAADVPAGGRRALTLVIQADGATFPARAPVVALFEYGREGRRHLAVASGVVSIAGGGAVVSPLVVGLTALAATLALLALAWRRAASKRHGAA